MTKINHKKFKLGDIVRIQRPKFFKSGKSRITNHLTGQNKIYNLYAIQGIRTKVPFVKYLVRKRFVYCGKKSFMLLDNYRPGILGRGFALDVIDDNIMIKIGKLIDIRKAPLPILQVFNRMKHKESVPYQKYNMGGMTSFEQILLRHRYPLLIQHSDEGYKYALLMVRNEHCPDCGTTFFNTKTVLVHKDKLHIGRIKDRIGLVHFLHTDQIEAIFPMGYVCSTCSCMSVLISLNDNPEYPNFNLFCLGSGREFIRHE